MNILRRVVITGIGVVCPIGIGKHELWESLMAGHSGVSRITNFDPDAIGLDTKIAAEVKNFNIADYFSDKRKIGLMLKEMDRVTLFAMVAAKLALEDSQLEIHKSNPERIGTFIGTGVGGLITTTADQIKLLEQGPKKIGVRSIIRLMPNAPSGQVAIAYGAKGRSKGDTTACASGLDSLFDAYMYIKDNRADVMISGGTEASINAFTVASFGNMMALSKQNQEPKKASRPFHKDRDGFVIGEGAVILILEELQHALKRNAPVLAEIVGGGASCDATHIVVPDATGGGAARAMKEALRDANLEPEAIDYINAHGTATPLNDEAETRAIKQMFGKHAYKLAISSTKSMVGHLLGASGAIGMAAAVLSLQHQHIHPTINLDKPDPQCDLDYVPNVSRKSTINYAMVEALGFGGHNTVMVLKRFTD